MNQDNITYLLVAIVIVVLVMHLMRTSENMVDQVKIHKLPLRSKRCALCDHCRCHVKPHEMPRNPVLYYGGDGKYLAKKVSPDNNFYMCAPSTFGGLEPPVPSERRQCFIAQDENIPEDPLDTCQPSGFEQSFCKACNS